ncbi:CD2 antigen cytoplasmic tail-binding protein 2 [Strongyloides ratti]|uniref:CD2 antigen cytoplasmic tail-binding protein 2 n=1 Tax=Strongyloides ratti TaxID=34506 RepID=A0A090LBE4_STRRB|nr:CD2 antigen cytoplasmic tail-binding protein 2 [Strongyloides ratti]CEF67072.1 CD2 antigen cytoplasmic tail-binding protein 2 [Strongyloides ratti]
MSKRQVHFDDNISESSKSLKRQKTDSFDKVDSGDKDYDAMWKNKHTLDSDEEDNDDYQRLNMKKIEGQEEATISYDGDIKITPFNMKEDEEDGDFDIHGNFIFKKDTEEYKDQWLETVDWEAVKKRESKGETYETTDDTPIEMITTEQKKILFQKLLTILKPKEDISKALKRLNSSQKLNAAEKRKLRWAAKKAGKEFKDESVSTIEELTEIADRLLNEGNTEAYQMTYEMINTEIEDITKKNENAYDMFGEEDEVGANKQETSCENYLWFFNF